MSRAFLLSTPLYSHISELYKNCVYEPAEDTFLLIDAIEKDLEAIIRLR